MFRVVDIEPTLDAQHDAADVQCLYPCHGRLVGAEHALTEDAPHHDACPGGYALGCLQALVLDIYVYQTAEWRVVEQAALGYLIPIEAFIVVAAHHPDDWHVGRECL